MATPRFPVANTLLRRRRNWAKADPVCPEKV